MLEYIEYARVQVKWQTAALKWAVIPATLVMLTLTVYGAYTGSVWTTAYMSGLVINLINIAGILTTNKSYKMVIAMQPVSLKK